jgi:NDP-sugar pyrophosphorylase family protein
VSDRIRHTVIMAAGRGQRMMPATHYLPKAMLPFFESTLVATGIDKIRPYIENIHVTVGYKGAMLASHLIEHDVTSIHNTDGRSNSWWLHHTLLRHIDEPVFVLTCDNVTDIDFAELAADYFALGAPPCLIVPVAPFEGLDGDYIFHDGPVVTELSRSRPAPTYACGIQVLNPARVAALTSGEGDFGDIWRELIAQRQLCVSRVQPAKWYSVDTLEHLQRCAERMGSAPA